MIDIQDIIPFMKKGWVAMDKNKCWYWHRRKPTKINSPWNYWDSKGSDFELLMFKIWQPILNLLSKINNSKNC